MQQYTTYGVTWGNRSGSVKSLTPDPLDKKNRSTAPTHPPKLGRFIHVFFHLTNYPKLQVARIGSKRAIGVPRRGKKF